MKSKIKSILWKLICILGAWTLVLIVLQGICIYYFVTRYIANKTITQTDLINKQTDKLVEEMQNLPNVDELKALRDNVEKIEKDMGSRVEAMERDIVKDLTPILRITSQRPYYTSRNQVKFTYSIENKGKYPVNINNVKFHLSPTKIESPEKIMNQLVLNKDFYVKSNMNVGDIAPGGEIKHDLTIEFTDPQKIPETIYYCVTFDAQTDPNVVKSVKNIDSDKIKTKKLYYILGDIITPG